MNTWNLPPTNPPRPAQEPSNVPVPSGYLDNQRYRDREVGTGYGRSSGYARNRRYAQGDDKPLFRCA